MVELSRHLHKPGYRGSFGQSCYVFMQTLLSMIMCWYSSKYVMVFMINSDTALYAACCTFAALWALLVLRSYMIFHDCGHGSFFQCFTGAHTMNWITLHVSAVMCGTPTDWNVGHRLHHANVGNVTQNDYDWGETVFHTATQFLKLPLRKQFLWRLARHPVPFFALAPFFTWYVKMRLPFELRSDRKAAYRCTDKALSTFWMACRYTLAYRHGIFSIIFIGDYAAMFWGVVLFHLQHVYEPGYVEPAHKWKLRDAAMHGSSLIIIPPVLKFFTMGIQYHHIHHFHPRIPGYMLETVHEAAAPEMWNELVVLDGPAVYHSLWLQVYDDVEGKYSTFDRVIRMYADKFKDKCN